MAISVTWATKVINVPKADMLLVQTNPTEVRELDLDSFRLDLKALEASVDGMPFLDTHIHNPPVTVGGVTLARVVEIINGYTVTFEDGQYAVNLSGANSNVGDVVNLNQVSVRSANSAGLTYSKEIEDLSFGDNRVWVDTINGVDSTTYPAGTPSLPTNSFFNAATIVYNRQLPSRYYGRGTESISGADISYSNLLGASIAGAVFNIGSGCNTEGLVAENVYFPTAILSGNAHFIRCTLGDIIDFHGAADYCGLAGTISLCDHTTIYEFNNCQSNVPGAGNTPIIDCGNHPNLQLSIRGYSGGIELRNISESNSNVSVDLVAGHVILDSSVTNGNITIRGNGYVTNNGSVEPTLDGLSATYPIQQVIRKVLTNRMETDPATGIMTLYDDDGTVLYTGDIFENIESPLQPYRGQGMERRDKLT